MQVKEVVYLYKISPEDILLKNVSIYSDVLQHP